MEYIPKLIIDERMRTIEKDRLQSLGYELIEISQSKNVYQEISSHVDIFVCKVGNTLIVEPTKYECLKSKLQIENLKKGNEEIKEKYPYDIKYNVCTIGKKAFHNFEYTDSKVKEELIKQEYKLINTSQGYTNCSIVVVDDNSAIVTDKGLYKILQKYNIDVLYLEYQPDIKLLNNGQYSNKIGFIGGAISRIKDKIVVFGDLDKIDYSQEIRQFIEKKKLEIIEFKGLDVLDYGGIVELSR